MSIFILKSTFLGILVTATKSKDNKFNYSTIAVVLLTECLKLVISIVIYMKDKPIQNIIPDIVNGRKVLLLYLVPAFLYCLYNNLAFINLASFDPTTYFLLLQFRVVITGVIYQLLFKRQLSMIQWFSLMLLTVGCIVKQAGGLHVSSTTSSLVLNSSLLLILLQIFCSCFAGVYNEYLLKDVGSHVHIMIQNVFMYLDSIVCNLFIIIISGEIYKLTELSDITNIIFDPKVVAVMTNNAFCGIVTSVFLKNLNSILKSFASALELVFTAILCWIIFGIPIDIYTAIAVAIVSYATYLYAKNPVVNKPIKSNEEDNYAYRRLEQGDTETVSNSPGQQTKIETV